MSCAWARIWELLLIENKKTGQKRRSNVRKLIAFNQVTLDGYYYKLAHDP